MTADRPDRGLPEPSASAPELPAATLGARRRRAEARAGRSLSWLLIGAVVAAALLGAVGWWFATRQTPAGQASKVGDCVHVQRDGGTATIRPAGCDDSDRMTFIVAKTGSGAADCPNTGTAVYLAVPHRAGGTGDGYSCLAPNLRKDRCYVLDDAPSERPCDDAAARVKVLDRINSAGGRQCPGEAGTMPYPELGLTYCLSTRK